MSDLQRIHRDHGIVTQAWSPIGGITSHGEADKTTFDDLKLLEIARQHDKSAAQVMLRWHLQEGCGAIPKSTNPGRIAENYDVFDFQLSSEQTTAIDASRPPVPRRIRARQHHSRGVRPAHPRGVSNPSNGHRPTEDRQVASMASTDSRASLVIADDRIARACAGLVATGAGVAFDTITLPGSSPRCDST